MHALDFTMKCHCAITFDDTLQQKQGNVKITIRTTAAKTKKNDVFTQARTTTLTHIYTCRPYNAQINDEIGKNNCVPTRMN